MSIFQDSSDKFVADFGELLDTHFDELSSPASQSAMDSVTSGFGRYIRAARCQHGLTPKALAHELNQSEAYIYAIEHGMIPAEQIDNKFLERLASVLQEEVAFFALLLGRPATATATACQRQSHWQKLSGSVADHLADRLADVKSQLLALNFGNFQFKPLHFAPSLVVTAIVCLFLISQDTFRQEMMSVQLTVTPTVMTTHQPAPRHSRHLILDHFFCAAIQPESPQGNTYPSLACDPGLQFQPYRQEPEPRGGYSRGI